MTRQTFSWIAMSKRIDTTIANAKAAASWLVKATVWVMKPGPMAEVAIRNMAPRNLLRPTSVGSGDRLGAGAVVGGNRGSGTGRDGRWGCATCALRVSGTRRRDRGCGVLWITSP